MRIEHVAIVGAGFSGTLQAINLLRHKGPRATLIERAGAPGLGLAYGAAHPSHVLNVRAGNMSAFPDDPGHFARWLAERGVADAAHAFAARVTYGEYLRELLDAAVAGSGGRLTVRRGEVTRLDERVDGVTLALADGEKLEADAAVLAVGNLPPHDPPGLDPATLPGDLYKGDPWAGDIGDGLDDADTVLVIGTGLTMVDVALMLEARGFGGKIVALSRRGLLPRRHAAGGAWQRIEERPATVASALVRRVRTRAEAIGWRNAVDELRPFTQPMWANASEAERGRFLRHLRPWWDVHRHRLAPQVADRLDAMQARGQLEVVAGKTLGFAAQDGAVAVRWRPRGSHGEAVMRVRRVVNCTGPLGDLNRTDDPLLVALREDGAIRPDAAHLGIDVNGAGEVIGADGTANRRLFALGPMTRGAFWEIVAVPDIRRQTWDVARRLSNAHWVGGEGL
ncbi:FAD-dependent oxidoreductase [Sphingomonas suaedae]|uniref:FAD-dependent oxidoreductase n=1 Tax=Sphingomonas suaedae TaxID=2599297 RepID=A0A518RDR7_9SPHN|nr:FAD/NAD(P)-binding protein [Sphingomonas suaedae]QDX25576.1 FAD-dependent oxidoreductase [Sphingomonas suaedae]